MSGGTWAKDFGSRALDGGKAGREEIGSKWVCTGFQLTCCKMTSHITHLSVLLHYMILCKHDTTGVVVTDETQHDISMGKLAQKAP